MNSLSIKHWSEADQPREKLYKKGRHNLSDAELLAIILGSGSRTQTALDLAKSILLKADNNLHNLGEMTLSDLKKFRGVGMVKAVTIAAALELGRRRQASTPKTKTAITSSSNAYQVLAPFLSDLAHEEFWILILNQANIPISCEKISEGGIASAIVDIRKLFQKVLKYERAVAVILCHNHPSGNLEPSMADIKLTKEIKSAGDTLKIRVLDHIIIGHNAYTSLADIGKM